MGMSASQARLLALTARIHDVEYEAQAIQNAKIQLATQEDEVYEKYLDALDATTLTVKNSNGDAITATMSNLVGMNAVDTANKYVLRDSQNRIILEDDVVEKYYEFKESGKTQDAETFAYYAMGLTGDEDDKDIDQDEFDYYVEKFNQIQAAGGVCVGFSEFEGVLGESNPGSNSDWLQKMIECGKITVETYSVNSKTNEVSLNSTTVASDTYLAETNTTSIDKTALAKAEAEYEHDLKLIDKKDKRYDLELSKLDTERNALTTQIESVKKVISDNIERSFGIFS